MTFLFLCLWLVDSIHTARFFAAAERAEIGVETTGQILVHFVEQHGFDLSALEPYRKSTLWRLLDRPYALVLDGTSRAHASRRAIALAAGLSTIGYASLRECKWVNRRDLALLCSSPNLESLNLSNTSLHDEDLLELRRAPRLRILEADDIRVSSNVLGQALKGLPLEYLTMRRCKLDDGHMRVFATIPGLIDLNIFDSRISEAGFLSLRANGRLRKLDIAGSPLKRIPDEFPVEQLLHLDVGLTEMTDEGIKPLARAARLKFLSLQDTRITDRSVETLSQLKECRLLVVEGTSFTKAGFQRLSKALPNCKIVADAKIVR